MNNSEYLEQIKRTNNNINSLFISDNKLIIKDSNLHPLPLDTINLSSFNMGFWNLNPSLIYNILYMLFLITKKSINEDEKKYIKYYMDKYLEYKDKVLSNEIKDEFTINYLEIPIYSFYNPEQINNPASREIETIIDEYNRKIEGGHSKGPRLVLTNPNFVNIEEEPDLVDYGKAGFTTLLLVTGTVIATIIYITIFIAK